MRLAARMSRRTGRGAAFESGRGGAADSCGKRLEIRLLRFPGTGAFLFASETRGCPLVGGRYPLGRTSETGARLTVAKERRGYAMPKGVFSQ